MLASVQSVEQLEENLSRPTPRVVEVFSRIAGDLVILGVGGKMGPTLARMARRASDEAGGKRAIYGISRFSSPRARASLEACGVRTMACDLLDEQAWNGLPDAPLVLHMTGYKFGASQAPERTWAVNCYVPALVCRRYPQSRIAAFSTGNVYGPVPVDSGGSRETDDPAPIGEYAMTALGRERMFQYFSHRQNTPVALLRLNYATELRYGVLVDIGRQVLEERPIDLRTAYVNVIWQADANAMALCALEHCAVPARTLNVAGPEILRVRDVAERFGELLKRKPVFTGEESRTALLNNGQEGARLLGAPAVSAGEVIEQTAAWLQRGGPLLDKPTHFEVVDGKF
jgi:nucleoside-diphosphate-sugar epimerase